MTSLTTSARLRHARAALLQARTLLREAANLGGGLSPATRGVLRTFSGDCEELAGVVRGLAIQCAKDLDAVRARKHRRAA